MRFNLVFSILLLFTLASKAQKPLSIYGTLGTAIPAPVFAVTSNLDYHFKVSEGFRVGPKITLGIVTVGDYDGGGSTAAVLATSASLLLGKEKESGRSAFFEMNVGYQFLELEDIDILFNQLQCFAGVRFIRESGFFFRTGLGIPEFAQFGIGFSF